MGVRFLWSHRALCLRSCYALTILESLLSLEQGPLLFIQLWVLQTTSHMLFSHFLPCPALHWAPGPITGPSGATHVQNSGSYPSVSGSRLGFQGHKGDCPLWMTRGPAFSGNVLAWGSDLGVCWLRLFATMELAIYFLNIRWFQEKNQF